MSWWEGKVRRRRGHRPFILLAVVGAIALSTSIQCRSLVLVLLMCGKEGKTNKNGVRKRERERSWKCAAINPSLNL